MDDTNKGIVIDSYESGDESGYDESGTEDMDSEATESNNPKQTDANKDNNTKDDGELPIITDSVIDSDKNDSSLDSKPSAKVSSQPQDDKKPENESIATNKPEETSEPVTTIEPETTSEPTVTNKQEATVKPETSNGNTATMDPFELPIIPVN